MELDGRQRAQFQQALLSAFPSKNKLAQMVSFELDWQLDAIAGGQNLSEIVFALIQHAQSEGCTDKLLAAARSENSGNPKLRSFAASFQTPVLDSQPPTELNQGDGLTQTNHDGTNFQTHVTGGNVNQAHVINIYNSSANSVDSDNASTTKSAATATIKTILFLASNPKDVGKINVEQEFREIDASLRRSQKRDQFILENQGATRPSDFRRYLLDHNPQLLHFSGHGVVATEQYPDGLLFEDESGNAQLIPTAQLAATFALFADQIECVLLNACHSKKQADAIVQHIPYVIGMSRVITDPAAIEFATSFYDAIGSGRDIPFAFALACSQLISFGAEDIPKLMQRGQSESA